MYICPCICMYVYVCTIPLYDIYLCITDSVTPVSSPSETITSVALDSFTNIIYYADTASSGVHRLNILGTYVSRCVGIMTVVIPKL